MVSPRSGPSRGLAEAVPCWAVFLITKTFDSPKGPLQFTFRSDGWFNMTKAAQAFGKEMKEWLRLTSTEEYVTALEKVGFSHLLEAQRGRTGGTWAHPKLAVRFARWLDDRFGVWCDCVIDDILRGKSELIVTKPQPLAFRSHPCWPSRRP